MKNITTRIISLEKWLPWNCAVFAPPSVSKQKYIFCSVRLTDVLALPFIFHPENVNLPASQCIFQCDTAENLFLFWNTRWRKHGAMSWQPFFQGDNPAINNVHFKRPLVSKYCNIWSWCITYLSFFQVHINIRLSPKNIFVWASHIRSKMLKLAYIQSFRSWLVWNGRFGQKRGSYCYSILSQKSKRIIPINVKIIS